MDYFLGKQWTAKQEKELRQKGAAPLVINRVFPACQQKLAQLSVHKPVIRAVPIDVDDNVTADLYSDVIEYVLQNSDFELVEMEVKRDHVVRGVGYYHVHVDREEDDGRGEVKVAALPPDIVYVDPAARKPDYSDATHIVVSQIIKLGLAKRLYPRHAAALTKAAGELCHTEDYETSGNHSAESVQTPGELSMYDGWITNSEDDNLLVRIIERYSKVKLPHYIVRNHILGTHAVVTAEEYSSTYKDRPDFQTTKVFKTKILKHTSAGNDTSISSEILNTNIYPIVPVPNVWTGTPFPMGDVRYIKGIQDEINKRRQLMISHATNTANSKWLHEEGAVDPRLWDRASAISGQRLPYKLGFEKPTPVFPPAMPNALYALETEAKHDVEYATGIFPLAQGDSSGAPETFAATMAIEEYGARRLHSSFTMLSAAKQNVGRLIIDYSRDVYRIQKMIRITGDEGSVKTVMLNQPSGVSPAGGMVYNNTLGHRRYDVTIRSGKLAPTNRTAMQQHFLELYRMQLIDRQAVLEQLDIPNRSDLIERMGENAQLRQALESANEQLKRMEGIQQTLMRGNVQMRIKSEADQYRNLEEAEFIETAAEQKLIRGMMDLAKDTHRKTMELDRREEKVAFKEKQSSSRNPSKGTGKE